MNDYNSNRCCVCLKKYLCSLLLMNKKNGAMTVVDVAIMHIFLTSLLVAGYSQMHKIIMLPLLASIIADAHNVMYRCIDNATKKNKVCSIFWLLLRF